MNTIISFNNFDFAINDDSKEALLLRHYRGYHNENFPDNFIKESPNEILLGLGDCKERLLSVSVPETIVYNDVTYVVSGISAKAFERDQTLVELFIPGSVKSIGDKAVNCCYNLERVCLSDGITELGEYSFTWCEKLQSIEIPDTVVSIGKCAFRMCHSLTNVKLSQSISELSDYVFSECTKLQHIVLPDSVKIISKGAFSHCCLDEINIPENTEYIGEEAFEYCGIEELSFPESLKEISEGAFYNNNLLKYIDIKSLCAKLSSDSFGTSNDIRRIVVPRGTKAYYEESLQHYYDVILEEGECVVYDNKGMVFYLYDNKEATLAECNRCEYSIIVPETIVYEDVKYKVTNIKAGAFRESDFLVYIKLPKTITDIDEGVFSYCTGVETIRLPNDGIKKIVDKAFKGCYSLYKMVIPRSVTEIGNYAFADCMDLEYVVFNKPIDKVGKKIFYDCESLKKISIPKGFLSHFENLLPEYKELLVEKR